MTDNKSFVLDRAMKGTTTVRAAGGKPAARGLEKTLRKRDFGCGLDGANEPAREGAWEEHSG